MEGRGWGGGCVALLRTRVVEAVLTDLGMPEVSGWEVARAVKAERAHIPVILLTGWGEQPPIEPTEQGLVDRVLGKPCRIQDIQAALGDLVRTPSPAARHDSPPDVP